jgi:hypothetical protein
MPSCVRAIAYGNREVAGQAVLARAALATFIPRWNAAAQPLVHLGFLLESPERAVIIANTAALVNVPTPARFAFHKLLVAQLRPAAFAAKADKDVLQAVQVLAVLRSSTRHRTKHAQRPFVSATATALRTSERRYYCAEPGV